MDYSNFKDDATLSFMSLGFSIQTARLDGGILIPHTQSTEIRRYFASRLTFLQAEARSADPLTEQDQ
jgi:hypothetical protein